MDHEKIEAVVNRPRPNNLKQLQATLGLTGFYRKSVESYAKIAAPIHTLTSPSVPFIWTDTCDKSFKVVKQKLVSYPILRKPDFSKPFFLLNDASTTALGAILPQKDENGNEYVISYASRLLKDSEKHYLITELECLAVVWAINYFRVYLYGNKFTLTTDHYAFDRK